jgi:hypothetical protein
MDSEKETGKRQKKSEMEIFENMEGSNRNTAIRNEFH